MLNIRTGRLWRSLSPDGLTSDQKRELKINKEGSFEYTVESLLPYAEIHDKGGFIASKGKMANWFWYMFIKFQNPFYKIMALSVKKRGGINIKATNYFTNAVKAFRGSFVKNQEKLIDRIVKIVDTNEKIDVIPIAKEFKEFAEQIPYDFSVEVANQMKRLSAADAKRLNDPLTATWKG